MSNPEAQVKITVLKKKKPKTKRALEISSLIVSGWGSPGSGHHHFRGSSCSVLTSE
jgi:hypothetical protein